MTDFEALHFGVSPEQIREMHRRCLSGQCGECKGLGETDCECLECGDEHTRTCDHCDGKGTCGWIGSQDEDENNKLIQQRSEFMASFHFKPSVSGFISAFTSMGGKPPTETQIDEFKHTLKSMKFEVKP